VASELCERPRIRRKWFGSIKRCGNDRIYIVDGGHKSDRSGGLSCRANSENSDLGSQKPDTISTLFEVFWKMRAAAIYGAQAANVWLSLNYKKR